MRKKYVFCFDFSPLFILQQEKLWSNDGFFFHLFDTPSDNNAGDSTATNVSETFEMKGEHSTAQTGL